MTETAEKTFTPEQIEDYCEEVTKQSKQQHSLEVALIYRDSVRIIRQLQEELRQSFIERRRYVDIEWQPPEDFIDAIGQLQVQVQILIEKEAASREENN